MNFDPRSLHVRELMASTLVPFLRQLAILAYPNARTEAEMIDMSNAFARGEPEAGVQFAEEVTRYGDAIVARCAIEASRRVRSGPDELAVTRDSLTLSVCEEVCRQIRGRHPEWQVDLSKSKFEAKGNSQ